MQFQITTFNIRVAGAQDGRNSWQFRRPGAEEFLRESQSDFYCLQEVLPQVREQIGAVLHGYACVGTGREADLSGESCPVFYRVDRFVPLRFGQYWLSDAPEVPGSRYAFSGRHPRLCTEASFFDRQSGRRLTVCNTHLDHESSRAALAGLELILGRMSRHGDELQVLAGDFNWEPELILPVTERYGLRDCSFLGPDAYTYHEYGSVRRKIDYIFCSRNLACGVPAADTRSRDGVWLSDHYPVTVKIKEAESCKH